MGMDKRQSPAMVPAGTPLVGRLQAGRSITSPPAGIACSEYDNRADGASGAPDRVWRVDSRGSRRGGARLSPLNSGLHGDLLLDVFRTSGRVLGIQLPTCAAGGDSSHPGTIS